MDLNVLAMALQPDRTLLSFFQVIKAFEENRFLLSTKVILKADDRGFIVTLARMRSKGRFKMGLFAFVSPIARLPQFRWFRVIRLTSILVMTHA